MAASDQTASDAGSAAPATISGQTPVPDTGSLPVLLFFNNFPPSNVNGGTVLIRRLLSGYPSARLVALTNSQESAQFAALARSRKGDSLVQAENWCGCHKVFPSLVERGRWGIGRLKGLLNWMLLPVIGWYGARLIRKQSVSVMMSVVSGTYFLAASLACRWTGTPLILIVHDDWVPIVSNVIPVPPRIFEYLMGRALRGASRIFVVSDGMRQMLKTQYGVDSEIQMPATEPWPAEPYADVEKPAGAIRILYMGNGASAQGSLDLLINTIRRKTLRNYGLQDVELRLCTPFHIDDPSIKHRGWVSESEARREIAAADVLFLPYGFTSEDRPVALTSFPAKSADYFASGKPVLVIGPKDSTIVRYAEQFHCAEVVTELSQDALAQAICRLVSGGEYARRLGENAQRAFEANQNIQRQQERLFEVVRELARDDKRRNPA